MVDMGVSQNDSFDFPGVERRFYPVESAKFLFALKHTAVDHIFFVIYGYQSFGTGNGTGGAMECQTYQ